MKTKVKGEYVRLGGGSFLLSAVIAYKTKEEFIKAWSHVKHPARDKYLSDVWDLAHRSDDFRTSTNAAAEAHRVQQMPQVESDTPKSTATKKKSTQKKE